MSWKSDILGLLSEGPATIADMASDVDQHFDNVRKYLSNLKEEGLAQSDEKVGRQGAALWSLTEYGAEQARERGDA